MGPAGERYARYQAIEQTLKTEFMSNLSRSQRRDPHETMAELFNALDRGTEEAMLTALDGRAPESAERIRALMFTFEDLGNLLPSAIAVIVRNADKREMALALLFWAYALGMPLRWLVLRSLRKSKVPTPSLDDVVRPH